MPSSNINNVWGSRSHTEELTCPSGQMCLVLRPDPQRLATMGVLDKVDILSKLVQSKHVERVKGKPKQTPSIKDVDVASISQNPKAIMDMLSLSDKVVEAVVVEPKVVRPIKIVEGKEVGLSHDERVEGTIYTDMIDILDKAFIFQHAVGGNPDVADFRDESGTNVAHLANVVEMANKTE